MPFIPPEKRILIDQGRLHHFEPGDRCYVYYKALIEEWRKEPRWATVHRLFMEMNDKFFPTDDDEIAAALAWQVFFNLHVMEYEKKKREENGDI